MLQLLERGSATNPLPVVQLQVPHGHSTGLAAREPSTSPLLPSNKKLEVPHSHANIARTSHITAVWCTNIDCSVNSREITMINFHARTAGDFESSCCVHILSPLSNFVISRMWRAHVSSKASFPSHDIPFFFNVLKHLQLRLRDRDMN